jgi:antitoxin PrlF
MHMNTIIRAKVSAADSTRRRFQAGAPDVGCPVPQSVEGDRSTQAREGRAFPRFPYFGPYVRMDAMEIAAKMSSKGQLTVPKSVREALDLGEGDEVVFRVEGNRAVLARTPDFLSLAGSIPVPAAKRNVAWDDVIRKTRSDRANARR